MMKTLICIFIFLFLFSVIFRWAWNAFLGDLIIILIPTYDQPYGYELNELYCKVDRVFRKRGKRR